MNPPEFVDPSFKYKLKLLSFKFRRLLFSLRFNKAHWHKQHFAENSELIVLRELLQQLTQLGLNNSGLSLAELSKHTAEMGHDQLQTWLEKNLNGTGWRELKVQAQILKLLGNQTEYEQRLSDYDIELQPLHADEVKQSEFVGYGLGDESLNVFRKITLTSQVLFEKVYQKDSADFQRLLWFEEFARKEFAALGYQVPRIYEIIQGKQLAVVYFEYLNQELDNLTHPQKELLEIASDVNALPFSALAEQAFPFVTADFTQIAIYQQSKQALKAWMTTQGLEGRRIDEFEQTVLKMPRVMSHGDLHGKNVGAANLVIDWDRAGLYPMGFDIAYILSNTHYLTSAEELLNFIEYLITAEPHEVSCNAKFSTAYFSLIFYSRKLGNKCLPKELLQLVDLVRSIEKSVTVRT